MFLGYNALKSQNDNSDDEFYFKVYIKIYETLNALFSHSHAFIECIM